MLKALGYQEGIFEDKEFLKASEMQKVSAGGSGGPEEDTCGGDCKLGCEDECEISCNECSGGCHMGPSSEV